MDFSSQTLRRGEVVIWSGALEKQRHDAATRPAPPLADESRPNVHIREHCSARGAEKGIPRKKPAIDEHEPSVNLRKVSHVPEHSVDSRIVRAIRGKWGIR
jgi:hypothetical protein